MKVAAATQPSFELRQLSKRDLQLLADQMLEGDPLATERCIEFVLAETKGLWHGRARAMMCRRLKHCEFGSTNRRRLVSCIVKRLQSGNFSEQFKDQLRLALYLDRNYMVQQGELARESGQEHVRRYGAWILALDKAHENAA